MKRLLVFFVTLITLIACSSKIVKQEEFSGRLFDYEQLKKFKAADGQPTLRWISPDFQEKGYKKVLPIPVEFYPQPIVSEQLPEDVLKQLQQYTESKMNEELERHELLTDAAGEGVLVLRTAIAGVKTHPESLKPLEVIPFKLVMAGVGAAVGFRDQDLEVFYEVVAEDSLTKEKQFVIVRKLRGRDLKSKWDKMELHDIKYVYDRFAEKSIALLAKTMK